MTLKNTSSVVRQPTTQTPITAPSVTTQPSSTKGPFSACLSIKNTTDQMIDEITVDLKNTSNLEKGAIVGAVSGGVAGFATIVAASSPVGFFGACMAGMVKELVAIGLGAVLGGSVASQVEPEQNLASHNKQK